MKTLVATRKNKVGATAIEYGLIAALISVAIITAISLIGGNLSNVFNIVGSVLDEKSKSTPTPLPA